MTPPGKPVRVRIAPSPTGDPHVGTAYVALFNYVFARQQGGKFVLRIEDTDQTRARSDSEQLIFDALHWIGLTWDEGPDVGGPHAPYRQSERSDIYRRHADVLLERREAYRCFCTEDRLAKLRIQQQAEKRTLGYDRHCRDLDPADGSRRAAAGEPHVIRLKVPLEGPIVFHDLLRGEVSRDAREIDDQVLLKSDGMPTYHLANVVDDHLMEISHVIRAEEWISSTQKHVLLYRAFEWDAPQFIHMPLLRNADKDKTKISKRKQPVSVNYYRDIGILPEALLNFLGTMGWSFGGDREKFTLAEMIEVFSWDRISLGGPVFNLDKLTWLNEKYVHELSIDELADRIIAWRLNRDYLRSILPLVQTRIRKLDEVIPATEFLFSGDLDYKPGDLAVPDVAPADVGKALLAYVERFEARVGWTKQVLEEEAGAWCTELGWKTKHAFMLLRVAVTGRTATPPLFETMVALGKEITRRRLRRAAEALGKAK
jgi:glutamyl-tRNA synthetase